MKEPKFKIGQEVLLQDRFEPLKLFKATIRTIGIYNYTPLPFIPLDNIVFGYEIEDYNERIPEHLIFTDLADFKARIEIVEEIKLS